jgi:hypothetical protein
MVKSLHITINSEEYRTYDPDFLKKKYVVEKFAPQFTFFIRPSLRLFRLQCSGSMTFWGGSGSGSSDPCL